jgi:MFS family permease
MPPSRPLIARVPFFYGWVVVGVAFVTMAIGVNSRTAFSLLFPPILDEFGWPRGITAGAFSTGFLASALYAPVIGMLMDRWGPRYVIALSALLVSTGLATATLTSQPWHLHLTLGLLVVGGSVGMSYIGHGAFLPNWFRRRRGLAIGLAYSGVGVGSIVMFPWLQGVIDADGWRYACLALAALVLAIVPLNLLLQRRRPLDLGLLPYG